MVAVRGLDECSFEEVPFRESGQERHVFRPLRRPRSAPRFSTGVYKLLMMFLLNCAPSLLPCRPGSGCISKKAHGRQPLDVSFRQACMNRFERCGIVGCQYAVKACVF